MLNQIFKNLGFSETAYRIYLRLLEVEHSSARQLAENLNLPRPTIYDNLKLLIKNDLVLEKEEENKKVFKIDDTKNLLHLAKNKKEEIIKNEKEIESLLPKLAVKSRDYEPKIKFYAGAEGIKQVLRDLLWYENIETLTMWPISEMVEILGSEYLIDLNRRRIRKNISIRGLWPHDKLVNLKDYPFLGVGKSHLRQLRIAPKEMTWSMSYWLYADKVAFISSAKEKFGFVVQSHDFVELAKSQFEIIWKLSKPIKPQPKYTDNFLKTV